MINFCRTIADIWAVEDKYSSVVSKHSSMEPKHSSMVSEQDIASTRGGKSATYKYGVTIYNLHIFQFKNKRTFKFIKL